MSPFMTLEVPLGSFEGLPAFPDDIPTAPLVRLSLAKLRKDPHESERLFHASKELGFFYLDLRDDDIGQQLLSESDRLFELNKQLFELGRNELSKFDYKELGSYMGYKGLGTGVVDNKGNLDGNEFYNAGKDDFLEISPEPFAHPSVLLSNKALLSSFIRHSNEVTTHLLTHLDTHLHLPPGTLPKLHRLTAPSGDQVRFIKSPPQSARASASTIQRSMGEPTDYGSLTLLFNRVGGLQVLSPHSISSTPEWLYVRPLPHHCITNLGDALVKFSNQLLRSSLHRVVAPPGAQRDCTRYSVVYFARPENAVVLRRLESDVIPGRRKALDAEDGGDGMAEEEEEEVTSEQWIRDKALARRTGTGAAGAFRKERVTNKADWGAGN